MTGGNAFATGRRVLQRHLAPINRAPSNGLRPRTGAIDAADAERPMRVVLVTEGTYPCYEGGVSYWCDLLVKSLPMVDFSVLSFVASPQAEPAYELPPNVRKHVMVPLWGVREALEGRPGAGVSDVWGKKHQTNEAAIRSALIPSLRVFLGCLYADQPNPVRMAAAVHGMYRFFTRFDFDVSMRSEEVWSCFFDNANAFLPAAARTAGYDDSELRLVDVTEAMSLFYHWLIALTTRVPAADVVHATSGGLSVLPAVAAKLENKSALVLTEHGIYLRERYLAESESRGSIFVKLFALRFARRLTELSYAMADLVCPGSDYNRRWELHNGCIESKLVTIYNGLDPGRFMTGAYKAAKGSGRAAAKSEPERDKVVVWVGRITRIKDLLTLLRAAAVVREARADVVFRLYGVAPSGDEAYYRECLALRSELGLEKAVTFAGFVESSQTAFNEADIVVLSSISEGFPYAVVEAMLCGRPVVATAVGGVPEALEGCGIIVEPRNPQEMGAAILTLVADPGLRRQVGENARAKAAREFTLAQCSNAYERNYARLIFSDEARQPAPARAGTSLIDRRERRQRRNGATPDGLGSSVSTPPADDIHAAPLATLTAEVGERVPQPLESLEIAAVLESMAVSDSVAHERYGARDVFDLADSVFARVRRRPAVATGGGRTRFRDAARRVAGNYIRGPLALMPILALILIIAAYRVVGNWSQDQVLALALGMTGSLIVTNGFTQVGARRAAIYISRGLFGPMIAFVRSMSAVAGITVSVLVVGITIAASLLHVGTLADRVTFSVSFILFAGVWLASGALAIVDAGIWVSAALFLGLGVAYGTAVVLAPVGFYLIAATAAGYIAAMALMLKRLREATRMPAARGAFSRPSTAYIIHEAAPYFLYGTLFMLFILLPHALGWLASIRLGGNEAPRINGVEVSLTISLIPLIVAGGAAEHAARSFWAWAQRSQRRTTAYEADRFGRRFAQHYAFHAAIYLSILALTSLVVATLFQLAFDHGLVSQWAGRQPTRETALMFRSALVAYGLLGWGLFNVLYFMGLSRPLLAVRAVLVGMLITIAVGAYPAATGDVTFAAVAFIAGSGALLALSLRDIALLARRADYHYSAAA